MASKKPVSRKKVVRSASKTAKQGQGVWLASLGAAEVARKQVVGAYAQIVKEAQKLQQRSVSLVEDRVNEVRDQVEAVVTQVKERATENYQQVESVVGGQLTRVLGRMGIPSKDDINDLSRRVAELSRQVKTLQAKSRAAAA